MYSIVITNARTPMQDMALNRVKTKVGKLEQSLSADMTPEAKNEIRYEMVRTLRTVDHLDPSLRDVITDLEYDLQK